MDRGPLPVCEIMGVRIAVTDMAQTVRCLRQNKDAWRGQYICVANVHTTVTAHRDAGYLAVQNGAAMVLPDGGPLSAYSRRHGFPDARRVTGPDLMRRVLAESGRTGWTHYFYGGSPETLRLLADRLAERYPGARVVGMKSPPYRPLTPEEDAAGTDSFELVALDEAGGVSSPIMVEVFIEQ